MCRGMFGVYKLLVPFPCTPYEDLVAFFKEMQGDGGAYYRPWVHCKDWQRVPSLSSAWLVGLVEVVIVVRLFGLFVGC